MLLEGNSRNSDRDITN